MRWLSLAVLLLLTPAAAADPPCRTVEIAFRPMKNLQIAVWIEDPQGNYVATAYVTRLTGTFGLANRPGNHFLHSAPRFPYGRRDMVLPVWAHKRNKSYGYLLMGGASGNAPGNCSGRDGWCDDNTIAYHEGVSSPEPFYCSPSGAQIKQNPMGVDVVSCASAFFGSKGAFATDGRTSVYPPRADLTSFNNNDAKEAHQFSTMNDLGAVSQATPQLEALLNPPIRWRPFADGNYVVKIEASLESDFNASFPQHHYAVDSQGATFNNYGQDFVGQPSVVYAVPITVGADASEAVTSKLEGYGDFDGATGTEHPADATISDMPGSGAGRLLDATDAGKSFRVRVTSSPNCDGSVGCTAPNPPEELQLTPGATSIDVRFRSASSGAPTGKFDVRYRDTPIGPDDFDHAIPSDMTPPAPGLAGSLVTTTISGLKPEKRYYVAVRSVATCDAPSPMVAADGVTTAQKFAVLHGCFIATAAYGTPMAKELDTLRQLRDETLLTNPLGQLAVASYYALSPPVAHALASDDRLRAGARALLAPIVAAAEAGLRAGRYAAARSR